MNETLPTNECGLLPPVT